MEVDQQISCINIVDNVGFYKMPSLICKQMEAKGGMSGFCTNTVNCYSPSIACHCINLFSV